MDTGHHCAAPRNDSFSHRLFLRRKDFLGANLFDEMLAFKIGQVCAFLIIGQIGADTFRHQHDERPVPGCFQHRAHSCIGR